MIKISRYQTQISLDVKLHRRIFRYVLKFQSYRGKFHTSYFSKKEIP